MANLPDQEYRWKAAIAAICARNGLAVSGTHER
jgi:hypothetical protein